MSKPYYPSYVKWGKEVGGADGLEELLSYAKENKSGRLRCVHSTGIKK